VVPVRHESIDERAADEAGCSSDEDPVRGHTDSRLGAASLMSPRRGRFGEQEQV
jgi:hypothetical protein